MFIRCPAWCGLDRLPWILGQVFEHEGPLPHPAQDQPNDGRSVRDLGRALFYDA